MLCMSESLLQALGRLFAAGASELRSSPRVALQRLLLLRALVTITGTLGALIFNYFSPLQVPLSVILVLLSGIIVSLLAGWFQVQRATLIGQRTVAMNLALDFVFLAILLAYTGGAANPLISYLLVLLAVAATLMTALWAHAFALAAMVFYTVFLLIGINTDAHGDHMMQSFQVHLVGMWVTFVVSAALISIFVNRMAAAIRSRELSLATFRENEMRNEQLVAIGTLAAGTAHALGTPLSTMSVLLADLDDRTLDNMPPEELKRDIHLLRQQVMRCKASLDQLTEFYHQNDPQNPGRISVRAFRQAISDYITNIHPSARIAFTVEAECDRLYLSSDLTVRHALINLIENAIRAAGSEVQVQYQRDPQTPAVLLISVEDDGPGIPAHVMENMGEPFISTREGNMGLGIFLANASIQRLGGQIEMFNLKDAGARTVVRLPTVTGVSGDVEQFTTAD
tara:strand:- start:1587 stop:2948 length:1362 start_codon:yes stop_codon:yes gene_type:complete